MGSLYVRFWFSFAEGCIISSSTPPLSQCLARSRARVLSKGQLLFSLSAGGGGALGGPQHLLSSGLATVT